MVVSTLKKSFLYLCVGLFHFVGGLLHAALLPCNTIEICTGGYAFHAVYKLFRSHSTLLVRTEIGRDTILYKNYLARLPRAPSLYVKLEYAHKGHSVKVMSVKKDHCHSKIKKMSLSERSPWYPHIKRFLTKLTQEHYKADTLKYPRGVSRPNIYPVWDEKLPPTCSLDTVYSLHISSPSRERMTVDVRTKQENHAGENVIVSTACCSVRVDGTWGDSDSKIKFIKTKKGFSVVSCENISVSSKWYASVKKVVQRSMRQYTQCKKVHESLKEGVLS